MRWDHYSGNHRAHRKPELIRERLRKEDYMTIGYDGFDEALDDFKEKLEWRDATETEKTLVIGNLNSFVSHMRAMGYAPYKPR